MIMLHGIDTCEGIGLEAYGLTRRAKCELSKIPKATLTKVLRIRVGAIVQLSVERVRYFGELAGYYREDGIWVEPVEGEETYDGRLAKMRKNACAGVE